MSEKGYTVRREICGKKNRDYIPWRREIVSRIQTLNDFGKVLLLNRVGWILVTEASDVHSVCLSTSFHNRLSKTVYKAWFPEMSMHM